MIQPLPERREGILLGLGNKERVRSGKLTCFYRKAAEISGERNTGAGQEEIFCILFKFLPKRKGSALLRSISIDRAIKVDRIKKAAEMFVVHDTLFEG